MSRENEILELMSKKDLKFCEICDVECDVCGDEEESERFTINKDGEFLCVCESCKDELEAKSHKYVSLEESVSVIKKTMNEFKNRIKTGGKNVGSKHD